MPANIVQICRRPIEHFGFEIETVALDSGYLTNPICKGLSDRKTFGVTAQRRYQLTKEAF